MYCSNCYSKLEPTWLCCPLCRTEIDKAGGIDDCTLNKFLELRMNTIDVLGKIIGDLEAYGKLDKTSSLVSSGANLASAVLWMTVPGNSVAVVGDVVASGLSLANSGVSLFTAWKENGLLQKASEVCKLDYMFQIRLGIAMNAIAEIVGKCRDSPNVFLAKYNEMKILYKSGKWQEYSYQPSKKRLGVSVLGNLALFIAKSVDLYKGKYSLVAECLKAERAILQAEYDSVLLAPNGIKDFNLKI